MGWNNTTWDAPPFSSSDQQDDTTFLGAGPYKPSFPNCFWEWGSIPKYSHVFEVRRTKLFRPITWSLKTNLDSLQVLCPSNRDLKVLCNENIVEPPSVFTNCFCFNWHWHELFSQLLVQRCVYSYDSDPFLLNRTPPF